MSYAEMLTTQELFILIHSDSLQRFSVFDEEDWTESSTHGCEPVQKKHTVFGLLSMFIDKFYGKIKT